MSTYTYDALLRGQRIEDLRRILQAHGQKAGKARQSTLVNRLYRRLTRADVLYETWASLSSEEQALWALIARLGQHTTYSRLVEALRALGVVREEDNKVLIGERTVKALLDSLFEWGLVFPYREYWSPVSALDHLGGIWIIPKEAYEKLRKKVPQALLPWMTKAPTFTRVVSTDPRAISWDLIFFWGTAWRKPLRVLKSGGISKRDVKVLAEVVRARRDIPPEEEEGLPWYLSLLLEVLVSLDMMMAEVGGEAFAFVARTGRLPDLWTRSHEEICRRVWDSLSHLSDEAFFPPEVRSLLHMYTGWGHSVSWMSYFWKQVKNIVRREDALDFPLGALWLWLMEPVEKDVPIPQNLFSYYPELLKTGEREVEAAMFMAYALHWLGMADLLYKEDALVGFRLTPARELWARSPQRRADDASWQFLVQPSFQVLCMGPTPPEALALAEAMGERKKVERVVAEYTLERRHFLLALQAGLDGAYAIERLEALITSPLPQNVRRSLEEWVAEFDRVRVYTQGVLVEAADPDVLKRVLKRAPFKSRAVRLNERYVLVPASLVDALHQTLLAEDVYPLQVTNPAEALKACVEIDEEGHIRPKRPMMGVYVEGTLRRFAVPAGDGSWRLTQDSVREAARIMGVEALLALLEQMNGGKIPRKLKQRIYLWTAYFGRVRAERVVLLHFPHKEALQAIRSFPGLARLIRPLPFAPDSGVAQVKEQHLPKVLERLRELGIEVEQDL